MSESRGKRFARVFGSCSYTHVLLGFEGRYALRSQSSSSAVHQHFSGGHFDRTTTTGRWTWMQVLVLNRGKPEPPKRDTTGRLSDTLITDTVTVGMWDTDAADRPLGAER